MDRSIGIIGLGFVGGALLKSFNFKHITVNCYDKYKDGGIGKLSDVINTQIVFLCLPTKFNENLNIYDKSAINIICDQLSNLCYNGAVVIKSTVEPNTTENLAKTFPKLNLIHNPEFLTAITAFKDFHNQKHIVLGRSSTCSIDSYDEVRQFYKNNYPDAEISLSSSTESECMKIFVNCFYASKIQIFNEFYLLCDKIGSDYGCVKQMMIKNGWINPMHTDVPGIDGQLSYGGLCFPKDTNALLQFMKTNSSKKKVLQAVVEERNEMREDDLNIIKLE